MLRDPSLVLLSRQHQHALALCVRIERAPKIDAEDLGEWQAEIEVHFRQEIQYHFAAEEAFVFPLARTVDGLRPLLDQLVLEHKGLREAFQLAQERKLEIDDLRRFTAALSAHIRKEERELFEAMQRRFSASEMNRLGEQLKQALHDTNESCVLPARKKIPSSS